MMLRRSTRTATSTGETSRVKEVISSPAHEMETTPAEEQTKRKKSFRVSFKKGWQTIRHTFSSSRNNKVVPSDPQLGPSGQRVFKATVRQNSADCLPGSCNWEQMPLKDPADPKSGSSGFEPQVTEEPSDPQPEQTKGKKKKKGIRACFIRGWRAIKQNFTRSRNNKVVPFPLPSDLEPSEQPGPSGQTCLCVFEPEVFQEPADSLPGSCNWEQTPLKGPDDPQQGPAVLEGFQEPADSQPGSSYLDQTAFQITAVHGSGSSGLKPSALQDPVYTKSDSSVVKPPALKEPDDSQPGPFNVQQTTPQDQRIKPNGRPRQTFLRELTNNRTFSLLYEVGKKLGHGCFGSVFEGIRRADGQKIAIKLIRKMRYDQYIEVPGHYKPLFTEVALNLMVLKPEKCPNIVEMLDWFEEESMHIIIMEYPHPCKTLHDLYRDYGAPLNETLARKLMWQALIAAKHCIDHNVQHGDLKSDNILVNTETLELKLIDFGCGQPITAKFRKYLGYVALEEIVYSLGDLLLTMVAGRRANTMHYTLGFKSPDLASFGISKECIDLIERCMHPENVNILDELLDHDWFKQGERDLEHTDTHRTSQDKESIETQGSSCTADHQSGSSSLKPSGPQDPADTKSDLSGAEPPAPEEPDDHRSGSSSQEPSALQDQVDTKSDLSGAEPPAPEEPDDHRSGSSSLEPSALQDPVDTKSDLSGDEPPAPEEPDDHRSGSSSLKPSALQDPVDTKSDLSGDEPPAPEEPDDHRSGSSSLKPSALQDPVDTKSDLSGDEPPAPEEPDDHRSGSSSLKPIAPQDPAETESDSSRIKPPVPDFQPGSSYLQQTSLQGLSEPGPSSQTCVVKPTIHPDDLLAADWRPRQTFLGELANNRSFSLLYEVGKKLGQGCFGSVFEGIRRADGQKVAIKLIRKKSRDRYIEIPGYSKPLYREVAINLMVLKPDKCPNIVEMLDWFEEESKHIIIMEYPHPCKTLHDLYKDYGGRLNETLARKLMWQALNAAKHCIDHNVQHGDLKSDNILVNTETLELKLIDFGCGQPIKTKFSKYLGYFVLEDHIFRLGVLLLSMVAGRMSNTIHLKFGFDSSAIASLGLSKECIDLIERCLHAEEVKTIDELLDHDWFKQGERDLEQNRHTQGLTEQRGYRNTGHYHAHSR